MSVRELGNALGNPLVKPKSISAVKNIVKGITAKLTPEGSFMYQDSSGQLWPSKEPLDLDEDGNSLFTECFHTNNIVDGSPLGAISPVNGTGILIYYLGNDLYFNRINDDGLSSNSILVATPGASEPYRVIFLTTGDFVICYKSSSQLFFKRYNNDNILQGTQVTVGNTSGLPLKLKASSDGSFTIIHTNISNQLSFRRYDSNGNSLTSQTVIEVGTVTANAVGLDHYSNNNFAVVYQLGNTARSPLRLAIYNSSGVLIGSIVTISNDTTSNNRIECFTNSDDNLMLYWLPVNSENYQLATYSLLKGLSIKNTYPNSNTSFVLDKDKSNVLIFTTSPTDLNSVNKKWLTIEVFDDNWLRKGTKRITGKGFTRTSPNGVFNTNIVAGAASYGFGRFLLIVVPQEYNPDVPSFTTTYGAYIFSSRSGATVTDSDVDINSFSPSSCYSDIAVGPNGIMAMSFEHSGGSNDSIGLRIIKPDNSFIEVRNIINNIITQYFSNVIFSSDGNIWILPNSNSSGIIAYKYNTEGQLLAGPVTLVASVSSSYTNIAATSDGGFVLVHNNNSLIIRRFNSSGVQINGPVTLDSNPISSGFLDVDVSPVNGDITVVYALQSTNYPRFIRTNSNLVVQGSSTIIESVSFSSQNSAGIKYLTSGEFVVCWRSSAGGTKFARYNSTGTLQGSITQASATSSLNFNSDVTSLSDGGFVIGLTLNGSVVLKRYDSNGTMINNSVMMENTDFRYGNAGLVIRLTTRHDDSIVVSLSELNGSRSTFGHWVYNFWTTGFKKFIGIAGETSDKGATMIPIQDGIVGVEQADNEFMKIDAQSNKYLSVSSKTALLGTGTN